VFVHAEETAPPVQLATRIVTADELGWRQTISEVFVSNFLRLQGRNNNPETIRHLGRTR
jgi:hypothetical protein